MQAVILAGGRGTRLGSLTADRPKPMLPVGGRPFVEYLVRNLARNQVSEILFCVSYLADVFESHFGDGARWGVSIRYVREYEQLGTGGALVNAFSDLEDEFLVLNGDTLLDVNYHAMIAFARAAGDASCLALRPVEDASRYGRVQRAGSVITGFEEKNGDGPGWVNAGVYWLKREVLPCRVDDPLSLERELFPGLTRAGSLIGFETRGLFLDMGIPTTFALAERVVHQWEAKPLAFLDRDGVLNVDLAHVGQKERFLWIPGAQAAVRWLNDSGYHVVLVTNQAGIAKGFYTEKDFNELSLWMQEELSKAGAHLDAIYYCPHHPDGVIAEYRKSCPDRKPASGMLLKALAELPCRKDGSFMIGNSATDRQAAGNAGIDYHHFDEGNLLEFITCRIRPI